MDVRSVISDQSARQAGDILVGAGTILTVAQADEAIVAGASFIVSPGLSAEVVRRCQESNVPVLPGAVTASEAMAALDLGITTVKFFPAATSGGATGIKALAAPFGNVRFVPTGGIEAVAAAHASSVEF